MARKPRFVVIATPRSGTKYFSQFCRANGIICSHEAYFTSHGPMLHNPERRFDTVGDASWLAPPFLPDEEIVAIHQVRHPIKVIRSIHEMGLFEPDHEYSRKPFVDLARSHFRFSPDPLRSALRFYIEWNERCEAITARRYRIEDLDEECGRVGSWIGFDLEKAAAVSKTTNTRAPQASTPFERSRLEKLPEYVALRVISERYGYDLEN